MIRAVARPCAIANRHALTALALLLVLKSSIGDAETARKGKAIRGCQRWKCFVRLSKAG